MDTQAFLAYCRTEVKKSFENTRAGTADDKHKYRTEGLLHSARLLELISLDELQAMIEEEHQVIFGEGVQERKARREKLMDLKDNDPEKFLEVPAIQRRWL